MNTFLIREDVVKYQTVIPADEASWSELQFDGRAKGEWQRLELLVFNATQVRGNFFHLAPGCLCFDSAALDALEDLFEMAGQVLEASLGEEKEPVFILNVTEIYPVLEPSRATWRFDARTGKRLTLQKYAFRDFGFGESTLFKVAETVRGDVLTVQRDDRELGDDFISRYEASGLTGLTFVSC